jgi:hypothetical protein
VTRSPAGIVFMFSCVWLPEVFVVVLWLTVDSPIGEGSVVRRHVMGSVG